jgi:hypothetical protein
MRLRTFLLKLWVAALLAGCFGVRPFAVFAQTTWTSSNVYSGRQTLSLQLGLYSRDLLRQGMFPFSARYRYEVKRVSVSAGFQFTRWTQDLTVSAVWFPYLKGHWRLGVGGFFHGGFLERYRTRRLISFQSDIFIGGYMSVTFWKMYLNFNAGFLEDILTIPALPAAFRNLNQNDLALSLFLGAKFQPNFSVEIGIASYEYYRINLFFNPVLSISLRYELPHLFFAGKKMAGRFLWELATFCRFSDAFTGSGHIDYTGTTVTVGYNW